jgi:hypothetical protein
MYGIGAIVHIINILPFSYFLLGPFALRRYNLLGMNPYGNRRTYYRQFWVRAFFGRFQYTLYSIFALGFIASYIKGKNVDKHLYYSFISFYHDFEEYDEEENPVAHRQLVSQLYQNKLEDSRIQILERRAKENHALKSAAFSAYADAHNI